MIADLMLTIILGQMCMSYKDTSAICNINIKIIYIYQLYRHIWFCTNCVQSKPRNLSHLFNQSHWVFRGSRKNISRLFSIFKLSKWLKIRISSC